jgi:hypothetical protein
MMQLFVVKYFTILQTRILCAFPPAFAQFLLIASGLDRRRRRARTHAGP